MSALPQTIVVASGNPGKIREIARLLDGLGVAVVPQSDFDIGEADETGTTFAENSLLKARHAAEATGLPAIADDSGLAVDALDGAPGVYSARFAGPGSDDAQNNDKLLGILDRNCRGAMRLYPDNGRLAKAVALPELDQLERRIVPVDHELHFPRAHNIYMARVVTFLENGLPRPIFHLLQQPKQTIELALRKPCEDRYLVDDGQNTVSIRM